MEKELAEDDVSSCRNVFTINNYVLSQLSGYDGNTLVQSKICKILELQFIQIYCGGGVGVKGFEKGKMFAAFDLV